VAASGDDSPALRAHAGGQLAPETRRILCNFVEWAVYEDLAPCARHLPALGISFAEIVFPGSL
jgi:hypothetical protein